jgi:hypothetical protein
MSLGIVITLVLMWTASAADVSGIWNLEMHWLGSDTHSIGVCTLQQDDQKLTGSCDSAKSVISGEVSDRKLSFRIDVEQNGQKGSMTFTGTLDESGRTIEGACKIVGGQDGTFTMNKREGRAGVGG